MPRLFRLRLLAPIVSLAAALVLIGGDIADARTRGSFGSRGARTYSAPPPTATAPTPARPIERSMTQPGQPGTAAAVNRAPGPGGLFNRAGPFGGLAAGFLGAGLIGLLLGYGL